MNIREILRQQRWLILVTFAFFVLYSLISLVNHYLIRTYALDLGLYTNALYDYSHFQSGNTQVFQAESQNSLADHFDLYLPLFSPFVWIFGTYTLLIMQIIFTLIGGWGIYRYFTLRSQQQIAKAATLYFFFFFGIYGALSYDYHSNVAASMLVPWLFVAIAQKKFRTFAVLLLLILVGKENMSFWMFFVLLGLLFEYRKQKSERLWISAGALFSLFYFFLITSWVMPSMTSSGHYAHFDYQIIGKSYGEAFKNLLFHPIDAVNTLFVNHSGFESADFIKAELHIFLLLAGLPLLILRPQYLLMLLPIYFQKLFHNNPAVWGVGDHYTIEFAPILAIGIFTAIEKWKSQRIRKVVSWTLVIFSLGITIRIMDNPTAYIAKERIRPYKAAHYSREYDVRKVKEALQMIPKNAVVSAQSPFVSQLALQDDIYQYPIVKDAQYIVLSSKEGPFPLTSEALVTQMDSLKQVPEWKSIFDREGLLILKKVD